MEDLRTTQLVRNKNLSMINTLKKCKKQIMNKSNKFTPQVQKKIRKMKVQKNLKNLSIAKRYFSQREVIQTK
jgi:hypothetical protein